MFSPYRLCPHKLQGGQLHQCLHVSNETTVILRGGQNGLEQERMYGGQEMDEGPMELLAVGGKLREIGCSLPKEASDVLIQLDSIGWADFETRKLQGRLLLDS